MALYDQSHNRRPRNALKAHLERPFKRAVDVVRNRVRDLTGAMQRPAFLDQYPAKTVPFMFGKTFGPLPLVTNRKQTPTFPTPPPTEGFDFLALDARLAKEVLPNNGNIFVNREGPFYWTASNISGFMSLTYDADPGFGATTFVNPTPVGGLFDRAIEQNGGALQQNYFFGHVNQDIRPTIVFDMQLYDRKRNRFLHENNLPPQVFSAQDFANKKNPSEIRFDPNSEIEPRIRLIEVRPGSLLDTQQAFNAAQFSAYLHVVFKGYKVLEV